jgi:hypothetical protein
MRRPDFLVKAKSVAYICLRCGKNNDTVAILEALFDCSVLRRDENGKVHNLKSLESSWTRLHLIWGYNVCL